MLQIDCYRLFIHFAVGLLFSVCWNCSKFWTSKTRLKYCFISYWVLSKCYSFEIFLNLSFWNNMNKIQLLCYITLVRLRVGRVNSPFRNVVTWPHVYIHWQRSPTHCLLLASLLFTKLREQKANVLCFNLVDGYNGSI